MWSGDSDSFLVQHCNNFGTAAAYSASFSSVLENPTCQFIKLLLSLLGDSQALFILGEGTAAENGCEDDGDRYHCACYGDDDDDDVGLKSRGAEQWLLERDDDPLPVP